MLKPGSLLLYKNRPARLVNISDRLEIQVEGGETLRVRSKDVTLLHPGPLNSLAELSSLQGDVHTAWEILAGEQTNLPELAELIYGTYTPASAWSAWRLVMEGMFFEGSPAAIRARTVEEVERRKLERDQAAAKQRAWEAFLERARQGQTAPEDQEFLRDVENLATGRSERSRVLSDLGRPETPENAHAFLLEVGAWDVKVNPYPARQGVTLKPVELPVPDLPEEDRRDLTHLAAFAIDDEGTDTPDDAISLEGDRLWVHVADVAALVEPDSPLDLEARARGMSLHLPEGTVHLLPREVTRRLGLGLNEVSPALSFGLDLNAEGEVTGFEIVPSWVRVTRLTYAAAEQYLENEPFSALERLTHASRERRRENGAVMIDFPEVRLTVEEGQVIVRPLPPLRSRAMVEEAMILTGQATARFATEQGIRLPFSQQEASDADPKHSGSHPQTLSGMLAFRKTLKRSRYSAVPAPHRGLGVPAYTQVTSPLRRYLDLVAHQQLRAFLKGAALLDESSLLERIGAAEAAIGPVRQAELLSEKHWTLVYLLQHPDWRGEGILVERRGPLATIIIPSLALECRMNLPGSYELDQPVPLALKEVNLPQREAVFRVDG